MVWGWTEVERRQGGLVGREILRLESVDSTNSLVKRLAAQGAREGLVVISEEQTAGRGRRGRSFQSDKGQGLYLSVLVRPEGGPEQAVELTAWTAVAVCDGIQAACGVRPQIKWINDLVLGGKKLCGILTELCVAQDGSPAGVVIGVGINISQREEDFSPELRTVATSLSQQLGRPVDRERVAEEVVRALDRMYCCFPREKQQYLEKYRKDCLTTGKQVQLITPAAVREAFACGVDDEFRLLVTLPDGSTETVAAGEVSVRGMYGYL